VHTVRGWTLFELLVALTVLAIVTAWAAPAFDTWALDSRRTADINALVLAIQLARSEAAKRGRPVVLCSTADGERCADPSRRYDGGWMVFVNEDDVEPAQRSALEPRLYVHTPQLRGAITANRDLFEFRPFGRRSTNGTVTFCDRRGASQARAAIVSYTGRPRVSARGPGNRPLACADFP
jgi:type IV fimbrial biogenesis protein FimT